MKRQELYRKTVDILYDAYFNDTLAHNNCWACSTGNIIAANMGYQIEIDPTDYKGLWLDKEMNKVRPEWFKVFSTSLERIAPFIRKYKAVQSINFDRYEGEAATQIKATGYTPLQLSTLEFAFESAKYGQSNEEYMYNGLVAVLEALGQIHEVEDNDIEVGRFKTHYQHKLSKV